MEKGGQRILELRVWNRSAYLNVTPLVFNFKFVLPNDVAFLLLLYRRMVGADTWKQFIRCLEEHEQQC